MNPDHLIERHFIANLQAFAPLKGGEIDKARMNRQALAILRRGLSRDPGTDPAMYPYIIPSLPPAMGEERQKDFFLIASLFALHPQPINQAETMQWCTFGASISRLIKKPEAKDAIERRFVALLNAAKSMLPDHLRHMVNLLKANDIPIDWQRLLLDLHHWEHPERWVQRRWAGDFWQAKSNPLASSGTTGDENL